MADLVQLRRPSAPPARDDRAASPPTDTATATTTAATTGAPRLAYVETYGCQMNVADTEMVLGCSMAPVMRAPRTPRRLISSC